MTQYFPCNFNLKDCHNTMTTITDRESKDAEDFTHDDTNSLSSMEDLDFEEVRTRELTRTEVGFVPVIFGNSLNAHSYAKEFFDKYKTKSIVITNVVPWTIKNSVYVEIHEEHENIMQNLITIQNNIGQGTRLLLLSTTDAGVESLIKLKEEGFLLNNWFIDYPDMDTFNSLTKKGEFARIASELGIPHPLTIEMDLSGDTPDLASIILEGPLWVKPSHRPEWQDADIKNQKKAYRVATLQEAQKVLQDISDSDFKGYCVVQEEIPGDDDLLVSIDVYCDRGEAKIISTGRKLMEQKGKQTIGNALAILSGNVPQQGIDDAVRLLEHVEWNGWANIDGKIDPRTGQVIFFEVNPRLGRSHYYITASGYNSVTPYAEKMFGQEIIPTLITEDILFTSVPIEEVQEQLSDLEIILKVNGLSSEEIHNPLFNEDDNSPERLNVVCEAYDAKWWQD